jgi:cytochrome c oxidase subunit 1
VLFGGSIFGLFSGAYYWWPKITGKLLDERLGKVHFWLMMLGFNVTFFPQHYLGLIGMPRRIYTYAGDLGWGFWNMVSTIGAFTIALSLLVFIANVIKTTRAGKVASADPWDGRTLEWSIPSPPPVYNFARVPQVHDRDELWGRSTATATGAPRGPSRPR